MSESHARTVNFCVPGYKHNYHYVKKLQSVTTHSLHQASKIKTLIENHKQAIIDNYYTVS